MRFDLGARGSGKTTRCVQYLNSHSGLLLTHSEQEAVRVLEEYESLFEMEVVSVQNFMHAPGEHFGQYTRTIVIDNLDLILPQLLRLPHSVNDIRVTATANSMATCTTSKVHSMLRSIASLCLKLRTHNCWRTTRHTRTDTRTIGHAMS